MKKILLLTLLALCMPVITNASVASYNFSENEMEKNEKDVAAPKDEMPTDDDLESMRMELKELLGIVFSCLQDSEYLLMEKAPNYDDAPELYFELNTYEQIILELIIRIEYASTMDELESCRQQLLELYSNLMQLQEKIEAYTLLYFVALTKEGIEMNFKIISREDKTVQVGTGERNAISASTTGEITIPEEVEGYRVISIAEQAFGGCSGLTSVTIPNSVTSIGEDAFLRCSGLTSVTIPNSVTSIGEEAFSGCSSMTSITIPESVISIGERVFSRCSSLTSIVVEPSNTIYDSRDNCNAIIETEMNTLIAGCQNTIIPNSVTSIGDGAFYYCSGLTSITFPNSVTSIGGGAFYYCSSLTSVTIGSGVTSIVESAFYHCRSLTSVTLNSNAILNYRDIYFNSVSMASLFGKQVNSYIIGSNVRAIGNKAFSGCSSMTSVVIPESVRSIGSEAFYDCTNLTSITIPDSVFSIGRYAFQKSGLTSITIPNSVTSIGEEAFGGCSSLTSIVVESGNTVYDSRDNCNAIIETGTNTLLSGCKNTLIPSSVTSIGEYAFSRCSSLTSVTIPNSVTSIGEEAFKDCSGLTSITIPNSVTSIGQLAFYGCSGLTSITIPNSMTSISALAFYGCTSLTSITIPESVTSIREYAFSYCSSLTSVTIPNSVTSIGIEAFENCSSLTSVIIPNSVTSIGQLAFSRCSGLKEIYCNAEETPEVASNTFNEINVGEVLLVVPDDAVEKYKAHEVWGQFWIETPTGIKEVESSKSKVENSIYDINGHKLNKLHKGINIIRMSDGTTKKVLMK